MAHLWTRDWSPDGEAEWVVLPLRDLEANPLPLADPDAARIVPVRAPRASERVRDRMAWVLLAAQGTAIWANGLPLLTGIRALVDQDELRVGGSEPIYFSTETLARREPVPDAVRELFCPRCRQRIRPGTDAVRCPGCGVWHHAAEELPCWSYASTCTLCPQPTEVDAGFRWTPEAL